MKTNSFQRDFKLVEERFPLLSYRLDIEKSTWVIEGELDICDSEGNYWDTFRIQILVPRSYPNCVPRVFELSDLIPRSLDWHMSIDGWCCVDVNHSLLIDAARGIQILEFIEQKVYPFFANQLYKLQTKSYAGMEYAHHFDGIIQYYREVHQLMDKHSLSNVISHVLNTRKNYRNDPCPCGSGVKVKKCHLNSIADLRRIDRSRLNKDLLQLGELLLV